MSASRKVRTYQETASNGSEIRWVREYLDAAGNVVRFEVFARQMLKAVAR